MDRQTDTIGQDRRTGQMDRIDRTDRRAVRTDRQDGRTGQTGRDMVRMDGWTDLLQCPVFKSSSGLGQKISETPIQEIRGKQEVLLNNSAM